MTKISNNLVNNSDDSANRRLIKEKSIENRSNIFSDDESNAAAIKNITDSIITSKAPPTRGIDPPGNSPPINNDHFFEEPFDSYKYQIERIEKATEIIEEVERMLKEVKHN